MQILHVVTLELGPNESVAATTAASNCSSISMLRFVTMQTSDVDGWRVVGLPGCRCGTDLCSSESEDVVKSECGAVSVWLWDIREKGPRDSTAAGVGHPPWLLNAEPTHFVLSLPQSFSAQPFSHLRIWTCSSYQIIH